MCGIVGYVGQVDPDLVVRMRDCLRHRGPNGAGVWTDDIVALGHRRLAVVDLGAGHQPMTNEDGSVIVVFNGEIYNHKELRGQLHDLWHDFRTDCDTEVIVHGYETFGTEVVRRLDGMFSFVLYDKQNHTLFGARDRFGKKPLYYTTRAFGHGRSHLAFAFASEIKALRAHPAVAAESRLADEAILAYLLHDYVPGRLSIYEGIAKLEPGCAFTYGLPGSEQEGLRAWRYWEPTFYPVSGHAVPSEHEAASRTETLLEAAVTKRLMADVPLGVLLSGGVDSSTVLAMMTRCRPAREIKTFSIGFDAPTFDESEYARQVAEYFGTDHHSRTFTLKEMQQRLSAVIRTLDEPFADPSILPASMLAAFAREQVTVALGGDGGDELFAGYDPFRAVRLARWYRRTIPGFVHRRMVQPLARRLPASDSNMPLAFRINRFLRGAREDPRVRTAIWLAPFTMQQLGALVPGLVRDATIDTVYGALRRANHVPTGTWEDEVNHSLQFFERVYLPDDILVKVDLASMMHSLEVRCPFLDTELAGYVNALPASYKIRGGTTKYLLKRLLMGMGSSAPILPANIVQRRKKGFGVPVARWIRGEMRDVFCQVLIDDWPKELGMFNRQEIVKLHERHLAGAENHYKELWALFVLALWVREHRWHAEAPVDRPERSPVEASPSVSV